jgi:predicted DNA-binding transcriptional regulator AlpA
MESEAVAPRAYLRVSDITRNRRTGRQGLLPVTPSTWWAWVKNGKAPPPIKLSSGCTVWREADVRAFAESSAEGATSNTSQLSTISDARHSAGGA